MTWNLLPPPYQTYNSLASCRHALNVIFNLEFLAWSVLASLALLIGTLKACSIVHMPSYSIGLGLLIFQRYTPSSTKERPILFSVSMLSSMWFRVHDSVHSLLLVLPTGTLYVLIIATLLSSLPLVFNWQLDHFQSTYGSQWLPVFNVLVWILQG